MVEKAKASEAKAKHKLTSESEEVPMPTPNMETCVFGIQMLKKDVQRLVDKFKEPAAETFDASDLATFEKRFKAMELQSADWKQKFVAAVAALRDYKNLYEENIVDFETVEDILDEGTRCMHLATKRVRAIADSHSNFKLERVKLPTFDGSFSAWEEFRDLFTSAVDASPTLTNAEKMVYLRTSLTGNALSIIQNFATSNSSYPDAWELVKKRYANPREIAFCHLRKLYELKRANDSASDLRSVVDLLNETVRSLKAQQIPVQHWDVILVFWVFKKLDEETRREWLLTQDTSLPTLDTFLKFLEKRACALDDSTSRSKKQTPQASDAKRSNPPRQEQVSKIFLASGSAHSSPKGQCICCLEPFHPLNCCAKFALLSTSDRSDLVKKNKLCFNCFSSKHSVSDCTSKYLCQKCEKPHHTLLHFERARPTGAPPTKPSQVAMATNASLPPSCSLGTFPLQPVLLATMQVNVLDLKGQPHPARVFVDNGSEVEFISTDLIRRLGLKPHGKPISVTGISGVPGPTTYGKVKVTLCSRFNGYSLPIEAEVVAKLATGSMPQLECQSSFPHLKGLDLADPGYFKPQPVDILLGNRFATIIKNGGLIHGPAGMPSAENTPFGWILTGEYPLPGKPNMPTRTHHCSATIVKDNPHPGEGTGVGLPISGGCGLVPTRIDPSAQCPGTSEPCSTNSNLDKIVQKFWESEQPDCLSVPRSIEDKICETHFLATTARDRNGRFVVELPFRQSHPPLGSSLAMAIRRFNSMERRIHQDPKVRDAYLEYFRSNLTSGVIEVIPPEEIRCSAERSYYMPYSHVVKDTSTSTKLRIVFDCSAKTIKGPSLNEVLYPGPKLQVDLIPLLVKFRMFPYVISADITKFFTQVWLAHAQKDFQRLVFRESPDDPLQHLRFRRLVFGASPSPYLAIRALHQLFQEECDDPSILEIVKNDILVDNVLTGAFTHARAAHVRTVLRTTMAKAQFPLRKWASNVESLLATIPTEEREVNFPLTISDPDGIPTLGLRWIPAKDTMTLVVPPIVDPPMVTKRSILSNVAKLYDPLGWLSPVTVRAKILLQDIWRSKVNWDDPVPTEILKKWNAYASDLPRLAEFITPRCYFQKYENGDAHAQYQLFGFCDASNQAYAATIYIRRVTNSNVSVSLVGSKTKVTPVKGETTPRSELDGAKLLARFLTTVISSLPVHISSVQCYTDSTSVLGWLNSDSTPLRRREVFVTNRVRTISELIPLAKWNHVSGTENPADLPSRGITASEFLQNRLWTQGPPWLKTISVPPTATTNQVTVTPSSTLLDFISSSSSFQKMKTFVAAGRRLLKVAISRAKDNTPITAAEMEDAVPILVKAIQEEAFPEELRLLRNGHAPNSKKVKFLAPFLDAQGILRVGGRLSKGQFPYDKKHPMLLPKRHHFTEVVIRHFHQKHLHAGPTLLLCILRDTFWIFDGPTIVKKVVRKCVTCHRNNPVPLRQIMAPLPDYRLAPGVRPFITTALDFAGPFILATVPGRKPRLEKHYFCVFVCAATKAVHLELVGDLTTPAFVAALTRFTSRRGLPHTIVCDSGSNFVGAKNELDVLQAAIDSPEFQNQVAIYAKDNGIEFLVNPPLGPHHGGLYEAAVKSAKFHIRRIVGDRHLSLEEFGTLLTQVEAALNSRPLVPLSSDPSDFQVLTPAHFLIGGALHAIPTQDLADRKLSGLKRWEVVQQIAQHFWKRFTSEYVTTLHSRPKWCQPQPNVEPGTLVLVQESDAAFSSHHWNIARVTTVYPGSDGVVRVVDIKTPTGKIYRRPITRIAPLPIEHAPILEDESTTIPKSPSFS